MAGFLYFVPKHTRPLITAEELKEHQIDYAFDIPPVAAEVLHPQLGPGVICGDPKRMGKYQIAYHPREQEWSKYPVPGSDVIVGMYTESKPQPTDLQRPERMRGYELQLNDGNRWSVPCAVNVTDKGVIENGLPCRLEVDGDGKICKGDPIAKFQHLWKVATPYIDQFLCQRKDDEDVILENIAVLNDAVTFLQVNYYMGIREAMLLDIFTEDVLNLPLTVCLCGVDYRVWLTWAEDLKKTESQEERVGSSMSNGKAALPQATSQPQLIS